MPDVINPTDASENPEIMAFEESDRMLRQFEIKHAKYMEEYRARVADWNKTREAADKVVRAKKISCGKWERFTEETRFDYAAMYDTLGRDRYLELGNTLSTITTYDGDNDRMKGIIAKGEIAEDVAAGFTTVIGKYHAPKKANLP